VEGVIIVSKVNMSATDRSSGTSSATNTQGTGGVSPGGTPGGPNNSEEQTEPTSTLSIFALDYKK